MTTQRFELESPEGNLFELPAGPTPAMGSGWFVMLSDLTPGTHTIVVRDETTDEAGAIVAAELTATVEVTDPSTAAACTLAVDREPAWDETFYLSGEGYTPAWTWC